MGERPCVLVLDAQAESLNRQLEAAGFDVQTSELDRATCMRRISECSPAVVVLALDDPRSLRLARFLRSHPATASLSVVVHAHTADDRRIKKALEAGARDILHPLLSPLALQARMSTLVELTRSKQELERVKTMLIKDELTGVFSRRYLFESMRSHINRFSRPGPPALACLFIHVDDFKGLNERLGPVGADRILQTVGRILFGMTRKGDVVARFAGAEFVAVLPSTPLDRAQFVADKLRSAVEWECSKENVTLSIGVAAYESPEGSLQDAAADDRAMQSLLERASDSLAEAGRQGGNRVVAWGGYAGPERRTARRAPVTLTVEVKPDPVRAHRRKAEVTRGGMKLTKVPQLASGQQLLLVLHVGARRVRVQGAVTWVCAVAGVEDSCGVKFEEFEGDGQQVLDSYLRYAGSKDRSPSTTTRARVYTEEDERKG